MVLQHACMTYVMSLALVPACVYQIACGLKHEGNALSLAQICQRLGKAAFCTEARASKQLCLMLLVERVGKQYPVQCWRTVRMDAFRLTVCEISNHAFNLCIAGEPATAAPIEVDKYCLQTPGVRNALTCSDRGMFQVILQRLHPPHDWCMLSTGTRCSPPLHACVDCLHSSTHDDTQFLVAGSVVQILPRNLHCNNQGLPSSC